MLKLNRLTLRAITKERPFGADVSFGSGLNILLAGNTSGKSTCLQAIVYGLGLERMFGPRLDVPLPYAMRERIHQEPNTPYSPVLYSYVELEIENQAGKRVVIRRDVEGGADRRLIRTRTLSSGSEQPTITSERDFFVHDAGAAQREDGFHSFLTDFIGWSLPTVPQFDGREVPLYLEAILPMMFVEQKRGWSAIQGPFPTFLRIQDVQRRVLEFILDLDAGRIRRRQAELRNTLSSLQQRWQARRGDLLERAGPRTRIVNLSKEPSGAFAETPEIIIEVFHGDEWLPLATVVGMLREQLASLEDMEAPPAEIAAPQIERDLNAARDRLEQLNARLESIRQEWTTTRDDARALSERIVALRADLIRNQDAAKLERLGSSLGRAAAEHICPTCHQELTTELMPSVPVAAMALEENIAFIKSQLDLCEASLAISTRQAEELRSLYLAVNGQVSETQHRIRELRQALTQPANIPSRTLIEQIVRLQAQINTLTSAREAVDELVDELHELAEQYSEAAAELRAVKDQDMSSTDIRKLDELQQELRHQLSVYGFTSFSPSEIRLSDDNFRPIVSLGTGKNAREQELGFEISASDSVRLKWAYYLSLLEIASNFKGNHLGLLVFDEPAQHAMELRSLEAFLHYAMQNSGPHAQIIAAVTSEKATGFIKDLAKEGAHIKSFPGLLLQPLSAESDWGVFA